MDAPRTGTRNQGYAAACGVPNPTTCINPFASQYDPDLQDSALCHFIDPAPTIYSSQCFVDDLYNGSCNASVHALQELLATACKPPASLCQNPCQFDADPNFVGYNMGNQLRVPAHEKFTSGRSHVELNVQDQLLYRAFNGGSKLTSPVQHHSTFCKNPIELGLPVLLDVPTSPTTYGTSVATSHATYTQSSTFHVHAAMEMSNTVSAPAVLVTSNSSSYGTSTPPEGRSHTTPASPTPSVNKGARRRSGASDYGSTDGGSVTFKVKTHMLNLNDGYVWKKYGEKKIKLHKFTRSYFWCDKKDRCGCEVTKRTQRCNEDDYVLFTYLGKHNHYL